jgi:uncharacterized protein YjaZ
MVPFVDEDVRFAYTKEQMDWCKANEALIYDFFVKQELLYENNLQKVIRYVTEGPTSTGMPAESPGNIGAWLGFRIVSAYMQQHPEVTLQQLVDTKHEPQRFLLESKYKPK